MRLEVENDVVKDNPSMEDIANALESLDGIKSSFAILGRDDLTYIQTSRLVRAGFSLEYQDGTLKSHFRCLGTLSLEDITKAFLSYAKNGKQWQETHKWELMRSNARASICQVNLRIDRSASALCIYGSVALCFLAVFLGSRKGANQRTWLSVFFAGAALVVAGCTTQAYRSGGFRGTFYSVTRSESPFQFWFAVALGYLFSAIILMGVAFLIKNN